MRTKTAMRTMIFLGVTLFLLMTLVTACGGGKDEMAQGDTGEDKVIENMVHKETIVETVVERAVLAEGKPAESPADAADDAESVGRDAEASGPIPDFQPQGSQRLIIKDANLDLEVESTDRAIDGVTQVAGDMQGYIISHRVWYDGGFKFATITIAVPVQEFENALRRLRGLATSVLNESASGEDVTDQYVDLQSRLRNLEATRDRIRSFLDQATSIEESLEVNRQLSDIEDQIEQVKGRVNFLRDRAAFSTITVNLKPIVPTPTPTATPTPTPTPTPDAWRPGETAKDALNVSGTIFQGLTELLIWFGIVLGPFIVALYLLFLVTVRIGRRWARKHTPAAPRQTPAAPPPADELADEDEA